MTLFIADNDDCDPDQMRHCLCQQVHRLGGSVQCLEWESAITGTQQLCRSTTHQHDLTDVRNALNPKIDADYLLGMRSVRHVIIATTF
jgi:hypothetical protein